jgi:DNA-binding MarR family transcriptional regulator
MLNTLVAGGGAMDHAPLVAQLAHGLDVNTETVLTVLHGLVTRGLVRATGIAPRVEITPEGQAEHRRLTAITSELTRTLYAGLEADELAAARRVLVMLTERADAHVMATVN